jgi:hypothetical protein
VALPFHAGRFSGQLARSITEFEKDKQSGRICRAVGFSSEWQPQRQNIPMTVSVELRDRDLLSRTHLNA